jgi:3-hydroxy-3-methylglutaryl CoA synthase
VAEKSVPGPDKDVVTMAVEAARTALDRSGLETDSIGAVWWGRNRTDGQERGLE